MEWLAVMVAVVVVSVVFIYNRLVKLRVQAASAWADIDVQLKRRHDLVPNLVEAVKGYAAHEHVTLERVAEARTRAIASAGPTERAEAEGALTAALKSLFALTENYPQLRAAENFLQLQEEVSRVEDQIQNARRYYNAVVRDLNTRIQQFPSSLVASLFSFRPREFFEARGAERDSPDVTFRSGGS